MHLDQRTPTAAMTAISASGPTRAAQDVTCLARSFLKGRLFIVGFDSEWENEIVSVVCRAYVRSRTLRRLLDARLTAPDRAFTIRHAAGRCSGDEGVVAFDPIIPRGVRPGQDASPRCDRDQTAALLHAVTLALKPRTDPESGASSEPADVTLSDSVLEELGVPRQFAAVGRGTLAVENLSYERRWEGSPQPIHWMRASAGSNLIHMRRIPASLPCSDHTEIVTPDTVRQSAIQIAVALLNVDLTRDLLAQRSLDIEFLKRGIDLWRWDAKHSQQWLGDRPVT